jgi:diacylglycerol kinase (ATP)
LPTGSGNDFVKSVHIPKNVRSGLEILRAQNIRKIDAGLVMCARANGGSMKYAPGRYFVNGVGIGFDAAVAQRVSEIGHLRGTLLYLVAVLQTLGTYKAPEFRTAVGLSTLTGRQLLIAVGNGRCAGGGFYLTPEAAVDDGLLDVCLIQDVPVSKILRLMPAVMSGKRVEDKAVKYMRTSTLVTESSDRFTVHADGEVLGRDVVGVKMEVSAGSLLMIGPRI